MPPINTNMPPINTNLPPPIMNQPNGMEPPIPFNQPPPGIPGFLPGVLPGGFPDFSKPPPGFPANLPPKQEIVEELLPSVPYYDLPAGLMIPLIKVTDYFENLFLYILLNCLCTYTVNYLRINAVIF